MKPYAFMFALAQVMREKGCCALALHLVHGSNSCKSNNWRDLIVFGPESSSSYLIVAKVLLVT